MIRYCGENKFLIKVVNCNRPVLLRIPDEKVIASIVANIFDVSAKAIIGNNIKRGVRTISDARHTALHFILVYTKITKSAAAKLVGRDHSSVIYAEKNVCRLMGDRYYNKKYLECDQLIREYIYQR